MMGLSGMLRERAPTYTSHVRVKLGFDVSRGGHTQAQGEPKCGAPTADYLTELWLSGATASKSKLALVLRTCHKIAETLDTDLSVSTVSIIQGVCLVSTT